MESLIFGDCFAMGVCERETLMFSLGQQEERENEHRLRRVDLWSLGLWWRCRMDHSTHPKLRKEKQAWHSLEATGM